eukprot:CAMPEP_0194393296 /NCGR_PEP_ID=MMETSP0174-20130528/123219_1 /TAXON_ID=216777 /ORGANISM="Proboscia alata, Strain PI-D3" /LENGTH=79 /DNA_ID=CAMNT_0039188965 /DNA_START=24 /DNA_END=263 /DNA_ORIENTATION=-
MTIQYKLIVVYRVIRYAVEMFILILQIQVQIVATSNSIRWDTTLLRVVKKNSRLNDYRVLRRLLSHLSRRFIQEKLFYV